jgi:hypothetical protein
MIEQFTYRELRPRIELWNKLPLFRDIQTLIMPFYTHHASLYGITKDEANIQKQLGNTKARDVIHYSAELVIDTDNKETATAVWENLINNDVKFELWKLNNYKFYIERSHLDRPSEEMCYQDRQFVKEWFSDCNINQGLDYGLYTSPFHLCRARGSIHEVTGAKSILLHSHNGKYAVTTNNIDVKYYEDIKIISNSDTNISPWAALQYEIDHSLGIGANKHIILYTFGCKMKEFLSFETSLELALLYAESLGYDEEKAKRAFKQGFTK